MASIAEKIRNVRAHVPAGVTLVCVSKFQPVEAIRKAYDAGLQEQSQRALDELDRIRARESGIRTP